MIKNLTVSLPYFIPTSSDRAFEILGKLCTGEVAMLLLFASSLAPLVLVK